MSAPDVHYFVIVCVGGSWEECNGGLIYARKRVKNRGVEFPADICFRDFLSLVKSKTGYDYNSNVSMSFQHPTQNYVVEIVDDSDLHHLKQVIINSSTVVHVYVVDNGDILQATELQDPPIVHDQSNNTRERTKKDSKGKKHSGRQEGENLKLATHKITQGGNVSGVKAVQPEDEDESEKILLLTKDSNLVPFGEPFDTSLGLSDFQSSATEKEHSTTDDDWSDDDFTYADMPFYAMPPTPPCPGPISSPIPSHSQSPSQKIKKYQTFKDKKAFKIALAVKCLEEKFQTRVDRSTKTRFKAICVKEDCPWYVSGVVLDKSGMFQIRVLNDKHTCSNTQLNPHHRNANKQVLGHLIAEVMGNKHGRVYRGADIQLDFGSKYNINISYKQAWRAKEHALLLLRGTQEDSFGRLPVYLHNLQRHNPGTNYYLQTDDEDRFEFLFLCIGAAVIVKSKYFIFCTFYKIRINVTLINLFVVKCIQESL